MAYEEFSSQKFSTDNIFTGMIDMDGNIYNASMRNTRTKIGIDAQKESELLAQISEMQETLDNYREKLIELGVIEVPKTPEQIAQEQAEQQAIVNQQLLEAISALNAEVKELRNSGNDGNSIKSCNEQQVENSKNGGQVSKASGGRNKSSAKNSSSSDE